VLVTYQVNYLRQFSFSNPPQLLSPTFVSNSLHWTLASSSNNVTGFAQLAVVPTATIDGSKIDMLTHQNYYSWALRAKAILQKEN
jgi:hypothetical protein